MLSPGIQRAKSPFTKLGFVGKGDEVFCCVSGSLGKQAQMQAA